MRFMMLMIPNDESEAMPTAEQVQAMAKYNSALKAAGALISLDGLQPSSKGARVSFADGRSIVEEGPFSSAEAVIGGYWMIDVKSKEEAVKWAGRCPAQDGNVIEVRQVYELADFPQDVQEAAG